MADWALWTEAVDGDDDAPARDPEPAEVDDSLEARRLSRWLRAMFGGPQAQQDDSEN